MLQQMLQSAGGAGGGGGKDGEPDLEQLLRMAKLAQGMGGGAKGGGGDDSMAGFESLLRDVQRGNKRGAEARAAREREAERERQQPGFNWQVAVVVFILLLIGPFRLALCMRLSLCLQARGARGRGCMHSAAPRVRVMSALETGRGPALLPPAPQRLGFGIGDSRLKSERAQGHGARDLDSLL